MSPEERAILELVTDTLEALGRDVAPIAPVDVLATIAWALSKARAVLDSPASRDAVD